MNVCALKDKWGEKIKHNGLFWNSRENNDSVINEWIEKKTSENLS